MNSARFTVVLLVLLALATFGCRSLSPVKEVSKAPVSVNPIQLAPGEWRVTDNVVVITDASGTMYMNQTFPEAKALTQSFVAAMPAADAPAHHAGYEAGSVGFGGPDRMTVPVEPFDRSALAREASDLHIMGSVDGMGGTTPLHTVIGEVGGSLEGKSGRSALVIFSDGLPDNPTASLAAGAALVASRSSETCIHTVQTGNSPEGQLFLKQMSELSNCGSVRNAAEVSSGAEVQQLAKAVFVGPGTPPVAAANPCERLVRLSGIEFAFDKAKLTSNSEKVLNGAVTQLRECPEIRITVSGYTDSTGPADYNNGLSFRRADAAKDYLVDNGIRANRLEVEGFGENDPVATNKTVSGRAQNRRVELAPLD